MSIISNAVNNAAHVIAASGRKVGSITKNAVEDSAKSLRDAGKGAIATEVDRTARATVRVDQFVTGATLATKAEARHVGEKLTGAVENTQDFFRADWARTKADGGKLIETTQNGILKAEVKTLFALFNTYFNVKNFAILDAKNTAGDLMKGIKAVEGGIDKGMSRLQNSQIAQEWKQAKINTNLPYEPKA